MKETYQDLEEEAKELYGYLWHFNSYRNKWAKIPRGEEMGYFNGNHDNIQWVDSVVNLKPIECEIDSHELLKFHLDVHNLAADSPNDAKLGHEIRKLIIKSFEE